MDVDCFTFMPIDFDKSKVYTFSDGRLGLREMPVLLMHTLLRRAFDLLALHLGMANFLGQ